jgi:molybdate transport system substrate-binding protein
MTAAESRIDPRLQVAYLLSVAVGVCSVNATLGCKKHDPVPPHETIKVAAAADLAFAFKQIGELYEKKTGDKVSFSFGSTGLLAKQIAEGAPFDVFAAANVSFVDDVVKAGACSGDTKTLYARGRIVLFTTKSAPSHPQKLEELTDAKYAKIAIANPDHAPYGQAAREAMQKAGIWDAVSKKVVYGENVQQTLQFAQSGNADVSIVALSLATVTEGTYVPIDPSLHAPIDQALVVCGTAHTQAAKAFTALVGSPEGRAVIKRYGFLLPGESEADPKPASGM